MPNMAQAITEQTTTITLPKAAPEELDRLAAHANERQLLGPGEQLIRARVDSATETTLGGGEVQAVSETTRVSTMMRSYSVRRVASQERCKSSDVDSAHLRL